MGNFPAELVFCNIVPVIWVLVLWWLLGNGLITKVPTGLVMDDFSTPARELVRNLASTRIIKFENFPDVEEAIQAVKAGSIYALAHIPRDYGKNSLKTSGGTITVYLDENRYGVAGGIQGAINSVLQDMGSRRIGVNYMRLGLPKKEGAMLSESPDAVLALMGNSEESFLAFMGSVLPPGVIVAAAMLAFLTAIFREQWTNSMETWLGSANNNVIIALSAKLLPHVFIYCLIFLFYWFLFVDIGGFFFSGSFFVWFACAFFTLLVFAAMAILIASLAPTWRLGFVMGAGYAAPALPFTGFSIPLDSMSHSARAFSDCLPLTWFIQVQESLFTMHSSYADLYPAFFALMALFLVAFVPGLALYTHMIRKKSLLQV